MIETIILVGIILVVGIDAGIQLSHTGETNKENNPDNSATQYGNIQQ